MRAAVVLLQKILVLASGYDTSPDSVDLTKKRNSTEAVLTLSMKLEQAQAVAVAMDKGELRVALRNPNDNVREDQVPKYSSNQLITQGPIIHIQAAQRPTAITSSNGNQ
jgi:Flp pilus assembly protein CpaB